MKSKQELIDELMKLAEMSEAESVETACMVLRAILHIGNAEI